MCSFALLASDAVTLLLDSGVDPHPHAPMAGSPMRAGLGDGRLVSNGASFGFPLARGDWPVHLVAAQVDAQGSPPIPLPRQSKWQPTTGPTPFMPN